MRSMRTMASVGFALALLAEASACKPPEVRACLDFLDALVACTDKNAPASGPGEDRDDVCDEVPQDCEAFFKCAAARPCVMDDGIYSLDLTGCEPPDGVSCP